VSLTRARPRPAPSRSAWRDRGRLQELRRPRRPPEPAGM